MMKYTPMLLNLNYKFWLLITSKKNQEEAKEILILQLSNQYLKHTCISFAISRDIIAKRFPRSRPASFFIFRFTKVKRHENPPPRLYPRGTSPSIPVEFDVRIFFVLWRSYTTISRPCSIPSSLKQSIRNIW